MTALLALLALGLGGADPLAGLPRSLSESQAAEAKSHVGTWSIGGRVGYVLTPDADEGTWTLGAQFRHYAWEVLAFEISVDVHKDRYEDGDLKTTVVPVELSALFFPFKAAELRPYGLVGVGLYTINTRFTGSLTNEDNSTRGYAGVHFGFGVELDLSPSVYITSDFRWILMQKPKDFSGDRADYLQLVVGINFRIG